MQQRLLQPLQDRCRDLGPNWSTGWRAKRGKAKVKTSYRPRLVMVQEAIQGAGLEGALVVVD